MKVQVYTIVPCPYCERAKALLTQRGIPYEEIQVDRGDDEMREKLLSRSGMRTFPQIFHGEKVIGGFQELSELDQREGNLNSLKS